MSAPLVNVGGSLIFFIVFYFFFFEIILLKTDKMPNQLPSDCLNEIFEHLEDKVTLHSCLLVDRLWCEVSVQILWKSIWNHNTLITCLLHESKEILYKSKIR